MNTLRILHLDKTYTNGIRAMDNISLEIGNGMFGLLGPNGAGKSSLMKTIAGLQKPGSGSILFNGRDVIKDPGFIKKHLGFLPQDFGVYPKVSAYDLLSHLAILKGITNATERKAHVLSQLDKVNLYAQRDKEVNTFSGGMRQRFGIAQALLGNPQIIIVDEPTAGLDPSERNQFNNLLSEIGEDVIVILSTHLVEDVKNLCPKMAIMHAGRVIVQGRPSEFVKELEGQIWQKTIDKTGKKQYEELYTVISTQFHEGRLSVTVYAEEDPGNGFVPHAPALEDVYFLQIKKQHLLS